MGWTFRSKVKDVSELISEFTALYTIKFSYQKITPDKGILYCVNEYPGSGDVKAHRRIHIYLLEFSPADGCWGYKPMTCCEGPIVDTCPQELLDLCPPHDGVWCHNFHNRCIAEHARVSGHALVYDAGGKLGKFIDELQRRLESKGVGASRIL